MKLFSQLTQDQQLLVIRYTTGIVLQDILDGNLVLDPSSDEDNELKVELDKAIKHISKLKDDDQKVNYLMENEVIAGAIQEIALEMSKGCWISNTDGDKSNDMIIDLAELEEEEKEEQEIEEPPPLSIEPKKKSKKHSVN